MGHSPQTGSMDTPPTLSANLSGSFETEYPGLVALLRQQSFNCELVDYSPNVIGLPPNGWLFYLTGKDLTTAASQNRVRENIIQFGVSHPEGVIILENYTLFGEKKRQLFWDFLLGIYDHGGSQILAALPTKNTEESVMIIKSIAKREQIEDRPPTIARPKNKSGMLADAQRHFLEGLLNCGSKKAEELLEVFDSPQAVIRAILYHPEKVMEIKGFGEKFLAQNTQLLGERLD